MPPGSAQLVFFLQAKTYRGGRIASFVERQEDRQGLAEGQDSEQASPLVETRETGQFPMRSCFVVPDACPAWRASDVPARLPSDRAPLPAGSERHAVVLPIQ